MEKKATSRSGLWKLGVAVVCILATFALWWFRSAPSMEASGRDTFAAMVKGDGRSLMRYALPEEISANNLTSAKITRLYRDLILPRLGVTHELQPSDVHVGNGYANLSNGKFGLLVVDTVNGPRASITTKLLEAWSDDYHRRNKLKWSVESRIDAVVEGVTKDRAMLDELGITTLFELDMLSGKVKPIPVATLASEYRKWREQLAQQATAQR